MEMMSNNTRKPSDLATPPPCLQRFDLQNLPPVNEHGWMIEQYFLRFIKTGEIPNLEKYLRQLNEHDWTCLLAYNPRQEFLRHLSYKMMLKMDWDFVVECQPDFEKNVKWEN